MHHVLPRNSPQLHHQNTTICTPLFAKTPAKTALHHSRKNYGRYFAGIGFAGVSESQKMFTTQYLSPSFSNWKLLIPRANGFASSGLCRDSYVLQTCTMFPNCSILL